MRPYTLPLLFLISLCNSGRIHAGNPKEKENITVVIEETIHRLTVISDANPYHLVNVDTPLPYRQYTNDQYLKFQFSEEFVSQESWLENEVRTVQESDAFSYSDPVTLELVFHLLHTTEIEEFGNGLMAVGMDNNGIINASNKGKDSAGKHTILPQDGYDGQLAISIYGTWTTDGGSARQSVLFHELSENFSRASGIDYGSTSGIIGAHDLAASREGSSFGNRSPGSIIRYNKPQYSTAQKGAYNYILKNWKTMR